MRRLLRSFETLLAAAVADPETPVAFLPLLGAVEPQDLWDLAKDFPYQVELS